MTIDPIRIFLPLQVGAALVVVPLLALAPPAQGRILLVPVWSGSGAHLAADEVSRGARLVAAGPLSGSLVVEGARDELTDGLWARGVLAIGADSRDCGATAAGGGQ